MTDHAHARRRYLLAKRSVDDRARNRRVRDRLRRELPAAPRIAEAGCGVGLAVPTLYGWGVRPETYRGVDADTDIIAFARHLVPRVLRRDGYTAIETTDGCRVGDADHTFVVGDALERLPQLGGERGVDLVLAQSFLDLVPLDSALDAFERAVRPGGLVYAPLTFDGETLFLPEHPADERVVTAFHADIDSAPGRDSRTGRRLLDRLRERDQLEAVGASDWIVRPVGGTYRDDERYFLSCILAFVAGAIGDVAGGSEWLATRRRQVAAGELSYVAHGYDLLWRPVETDE